MSLLALTVTIQFQNCGKAGFTDSSLATNGLVEEASDDSVPFAFDPILDTISYDSCFGGNTANSAAHYTFKVGAYDKGGVALTSDYLNHVTSTLKPTYPNSVVTIEQVKQYTSETAINKGAAIQLALRNKSNTDVIINSSGTGSGTAVAGSDFAELLGPLTSDIWMSSLFATNSERSSLAQPNRFFPLADPGTNILEGSLRFNYSSGSPSATGYAANKLRDFLANGYLLSLTFAPELSEQLFFARRSGTDTTKAFGRGYKLEFRNSASLPSADRPIFHSRNGETGSPKSIVPPNLLTSVTEFDLNDSKTAIRTTWECPAQLKLIVIDNNQQLIQQPNICPEEDVTSLTASEMQYLDIARRHLRPELWRINIRQGCAVPLGGDPNRCYSESSTAAAQAEYFSSQDCHSYLNSNPSLTKICANYVSFCIKVN